MSWENFATKVLFFSDTLWFVSAKLRVFAYQQNATNLETYLKQFRGLLYMSPNLTCVLVFFGGLSLPCEYGDRGKNHR